MSSHSYPSIRLYVAETLAPAMHIVVRADQSHYLLEVMRRKAGDEVVLFNGRDGEWIATLAETGKKRAVLQVKNQRKAQPASGGPWLVFAPLKGGKTEWVVEKATELGVERICPVITKHTVVDRINETRLMAVAVEAAEQCERLTVPEIAPLTSLEKLLGSWPADRRLIAANESGAGENAKTLLPGLKQRLYGALVGPEGGFSAIELELLRTLPYVTSISLGPRILRADTASVVSLSLLQAFCGDWEGKPSFRSVST